MEDLSGTSRIKEIKKKETRSQLNESAQYFEEWNWNWKTSLFFIRLSLIKIYWTEKKLLKNRSACNFRAKGCPLTGFFDKFCVMTKSWQMTEFVHFLQLCWKVLNHVLEVEDRLPEVRSSFFWFHSQFHELSIAVHTPHLGSLKWLLICVPSAHRRRPFPQSTGDLGGDAFTRSDWWGELLCHNCNLISFL